MSADVMKSFKELDFKVQLSYEYFLEREDWFKGCDRVEKLWSYAKENVSFYKNLSSFDEFHFNKKEYIDSPEKFRSHLVHFGVLGNIVKSTGTSGTPSEINIDSASWFDLNFNFFNEVVKELDLELEELGSFKLGVTFISDKKNRKGFICRNPALNQSLYCRLQVPQNSSNTESIKFLLNSPSFIIYSKPSYLIRLIRQLKSLKIHSLPWTPSVILTSGEPIYENQKKTIEDYFKCSVADIIASSEGGLVAIRHPNMDQYRVVESSVAIKPLSNIAGYDQLILTNKKYTGSVFINYLTDDYFHIDDANKNITEFYGKNAKYLVKENGDKLLCKEIDTKASVYTFIEDFHVYKDTRGWNFNYRSTGDDFIGAKNISGLKEFLVEYLGTSNVFISEENEIDSGPKNIRYKRKEGVFI